MTDMELLQRIHDLERRMQRLEQHRHGGDDIVGLVKITTGTYGGGIAVKLTAQENLSAGELVCFGQGVGGVDGKVKKTPTTGNEIDMPIGVVFEDALADASVWVVVSGKAWVLPESGVTAARGNIAYVSNAESGRAEQAVSGSTAEHWREVGHWIQDGSGNGVRTPLIMHFN